MNHSARVPVHLATLATLAALACVSLALPAAQAHVTVEPRTALAGSAYQARFRIGHGCQGSPTHTVTVELPEGFRAAKPMPKPGWTLTLHQQAPAAAQGDAAAAAAPRPAQVVAVTWQAASREAWLDDAWFDEFSLRGQLPDRAGPLWFKVRQVCAQGRHDWVQLPASGTSTQGLASPAVLLELTAAEPAPASAAPAAHRH